MSQDERPSGGVLESFRKLCDAGLAQVQNRIELFAVEMQEEKARLLRIIVLAAGVFFLAGVAVVMVTLTLVWLAGESARVPVLIGVTALYVAAAVAGFLVSSKKGFLFRAAAKGLSVWQIGKRLAPLCRRAFEAFSRRKEP